MTEVGVASSAQEAAGAKAGSLATAQSSQSWRQDFRVNIRHLGIKEKRPKDRITHAGWA